MDKSIEAVITPLRKKILKRWNKNSQHRTINLLSSPACCTNVIQKIVIALSLKVENAAKNENLVLGCETNIHYGKLLLFVS